MGTKAQPRRTASATVFDHLRQESGLYRRELRVRRPAAGRQARQRRIARLLSLASALSRAVSDADRSLKDRIQSGEGRGQRDYREGPSPTLIRTAQSDGAGPGLRASAAKTKLESENSKRMERSSRLGANSPVSGRREIPHYRYRDLNEAACAYRLRHADAARGMTERWTLRVR